MALHADQVGQRVVVRSLVEGERGPSGGPALTDTLGILVDWSRDEVAVRREDGTTAVIRQAEIVTAKPVPPRASVRARFPAAELERIVAAGWRAPTEQPLGEWLLRAGGGFTGRANSVLAVGDPATDFAAAVQSVVAFYHAHQLPPQAQLIVGSPQLAAFERSGWERARPDEPDAIVQVTSVAQALRRRPAAADVDVLLADEVSDGWLSRYGRTADHDAGVVRQVLHSGEQLAFATVGARADAIGRAVVTGDWVGISAVEVAPDLRARGVATAVVAELLDWAASLGARSAYLQTLPNNEAALALYARFGFTTHHAYRYLRPSTQAG